MVSGSAVRAGGGVAVGVLALLLALLPVPAGAGAAEPAVGGVVEQGFPPHGPQRTAWRLRWVRRGAGLALRGAWFRPRPGAPWQRVLTDARLAELFTPHHDGAPRRFELAAARPLPVADGELAPGGARLDPYVARELRDRGVVRRGAGDAGRGWELVLRSSFATATCRHLVEVALRDDGGLAFRLGTAAGGGVEEGEDAPDEDGHLHDAWWRLDVDLEGPLHDGVLLFRHVEPEGSGRALDLAAELNASREGGVERTAGRFNGLWLYDQEIQRRGGDFYELRFQAPIAPRHPEPFARHDVWVTRHHPGETDVRRLAEYAADGELITGKDVVVWLVTPHHHRPRGAGDGVEWSGFELLRRAGPM